MLKQLPSFMLVTLLLVACATPLTLNSRFDATGEYKKTSRKPVVGSASEVKVFYANSPEGFSLKENELKVEKGFKHEIIGTVKAQVDKGSCSEGNPSKDLVVSTLQSKAYEIGANAIIYVVSDLPDQPKELEVCNIISQRATNPYVWSGITVGSGWAVVVK